ncbi:hypothetical protein Tcan_08263 [Toxocara canis]|uniref:Uncharacterized protein n=1 Tax=Toxocara canis TaxID=6265 RepID=A0A0B2V4N1_TOXCA|nr:hypothetical protein Tcan_08263 [Toxocara canis]
MCNLVSVRLFACKADAPDSRTRNVSSMKVDRSDLWKGDGFQKSTRDIPSICSFLNQHHRFIFNSRHSFSPSTCNRQYLKSFTFEAVIGLHAAADAVAVVTTIAVLEDATTTAAVGSNMIACGDRQW